MQTTRSCAQISIFGDVVVQWNSEDGKSKKEYGRNSKLGDTLLVFAIIPVTATATAEALLIWEDEL